MGLHHTDLSPDVLGLLREGAVIPAHPLALDAGRKLDELARFTNAFRA